MRLLASDLITLYRPKFCGLRIFLREKKEPEEEPSPYEEVLRRLGIRHEQEHLATLGIYVDLGGFPEPDRPAKTIELITQQTPVIYQPRFEAQTTIGGVDVTIVGQPDFLISHGSEYIIRDSKISRRIDEKNHAEIVLQVQLYGWLFKETMGQLPKQLQVHNGKGDIVTIPFDDGSAALEQLAEILHLKLLEEEPYEPAGWTKCTGCGFYSRCWQIAERQSNVALVPDVDQALAAALHQEGVCSRRDLLDRFDMETLSQFKRPWGAKTQKVGKRAEKILLLAEVMEIGKERIIRQPAIPSFGNYVMFDLEGLPPHLDELDKIYLWGMQVFGEKPSSFLAATAGFGHDGDRAGWEDFLRLAQGVFDAYGDLPFVHWHHYEKTNISKYITRFGDANGVGTRVIRNLLDLLPITRDSIALPIPSYSLKVVEKYVGYQRTQNECGGDWAMATFIEATETDDQNKRFELMGQILDYNREDLEATWAVFQWLQAKGASAAAAGV